MVVAPSTGRIPASAYLNPLISHEIAFIMGEDFDKNIRESLPLQKWVSLLKYFKGVATTKMTAEADTLTRLMHSD